jgi:hypothetical protein
VGVVALVGGDQRFALDAVRHGGRPWMAPKSLWASSFQPSS